MDVRKVSRWFWYLTLCLCAGGFGLAVPGLTEAGVEEDMAQAQQAFERADVVGAISLLRKAAEQGHAPAQTRLAYLLDYSEQNEEAVGWYRKAADQGFAEGEYGLGEMYAKGEGVPRDPGQAVAWFNRAAERGHPPAIRVLATAYEKANLGLEVDHQRAVSWLQKGVELGDGWSISRLARAYRGGDLGLATDESRAQSLETKLKKSQ